MQRGFTRVTLNGDLQEIGRLTVEPEPNFKVRVAYRMPDQSLALFGSVYNPVFMRGSYEDAAAMTLDATLQHAKVLDLSPKHQCFWTDAAVPLSKPGEFVSAQGEIDYADHSDFTPPPNKTGLGVALDFIRLKPFN